MPYTTIFLAFIVLGAVERSNASLGLKRAAVTLSIIIYSLFFGLRGFIMTDFVNYYQAFQTITYESTSAENYSYSAAFFWLVYCAKVLLGSYELYVLATAVLHASLLGWIIFRLIGNVGLGFAFFLAYRGIFFEVNLMQNYISMLFFLWSVPALMLIRPFRFTFLNALGGAIHYASAPYLVLYYPLKHRLHPYIYALMYVGATIYCLTKQTVLVDSLQIIAGVLGEPAREFFNSYLKHGNSYSSVLGMLERASIFLVFLIYYHQINARFRYFKIFFVLYFFYCISYLLFWSNEAIASRLSLLFVCSVWLLIPMFLLSLKGFDRVIFFILFLSLGVSKIWLSTRDDISAYQTVFSGKTFLESAEDARLHNENNK